MNTRLTPRGEKVRDALLAATAFGSLTGFMLLVVLALAHYLTQPMVGG